MAVESTARPSVLRKPVLVPIAVYLVSFLLPVLVMSVPVVVLPLTGEDQSSHLYLFGTLGQLLMDIPAVIMFVRRKRKQPEETSQTAGTRTQWFSLLIGLFVALALDLLRFLAVGRLMGGRFMGGVPAFTQAVDLGFPWSIPAGAAALLAYGPGEALFVVYLMLAFDGALGNSRKAFSPGVIVTSVLWALPHVFNVFYFGIGALPNVLIMFFVGLIVGVLLKKTGSAWGPVVFWTLVNGTSL